jgi:hypothetical protein
MTPEKRRVLLILSRTVTILMALMAIAFILWGHYHDVELERVGIRFSTFVLIFAALSIAFSKKRA